MGMQSAAFNTATTEGESTVTKLVPYLCCKDAVKAIDFYTRAFGATESLRLAETGGRIAHAEVRIGDEVLMLSDEYPEMDVRAPNSLGGTPITLTLEVPDVDDVVKRAVTLGATLEQPVKDQFYGDRSGTLRDPCGHRWMIRTRREKLSEQEVKRRYAELMQQHA
jgi:PhnB protein